MFITTVLSHLGAWYRLQNDYPVEFQELQQVVEKITNIQMNQRKRKGHDRLVYSLDDIRTKLEHEFKSLGWQTSTPDTKLELRKGERIRTSEVKAIKNDIGVDYIFGKFAFIESDIFVKFPLFIQANRFKIGFVLVPTESLTRSMSIGTGSFGKVKDRIKALSPFPLKYPFSIVGLSNEPADIRVEELTSDLDQFLIEAIGYSLVEMRLQTEKPKYDFKEDLSENNRSTAKEICALANLPGGGVILLGLDNDGNICGIPRVELDETQLRIVQIGRDNCTPQPNIDLQVFDDPNSPERCVLTIRVFESERKPCMAFDKVFIRIGSSARPANSDEIRKLIIGSDA